MKNIIITIGALALCLQAQAQNRTLSTTDGVTYSGITLQRVEPDGLYIEYTIPGGGIGMSKVKFDRLSRTEQKHFGYSETDAQDYEAAVAEANQNVAKELTDRYELQQNTRHQQDTENQKVYASRMAEITRLNAEQAAAFYNTTKADAHKERVLELWSQFSNGDNRNIATQTSFTPPAPDIFSRGVVTKAH